jgi:hypothetical protein
VRSRGLSGDGNKKAGTRSPAQKHRRRGFFITCVVNGTIGRGRGRVLRPVDVMVSALEHTGCGAGCIDELHLPDITTQI